MRILYGLPTTGNGHVTRSAAIIEELEKFAEVDVLLSGPGFGLEGMLKNVKYKVHGIPLIFGQNGKLSIKGTVLESKIHFLVEDILNMDLSPYDLVITDSEPVTAIASKLQQKKCIGIGNQYTYIANVFPNSVTLNPVSKKFLLSIIGGDHNLGIYYDKIGDSVFEPIIRKEIRNAPVENKEHITVYLSSTEPEVIKNSLSAIPDVEFHVFCPRLEKNYKYKNVHFKDKTDFVTSFATCSGFITSPGFTATSEALYMGKKMLLVAPAHIEQKLNAKYLKSIGVKVADEISHNFKEAFEDWQKNYVPVKKQYKDSVDEIIKEIKKIYDKPKKRYKIPEISYRELTKLFKSLT